MDSTVILLVIVFCISLSISIGVGIYFATAATTAAPTTTTATTAATTAAPTANNLIKHKSSGKCMYTDGTVKADRSGVSAMYAEFKTCDNNDSQQKFTIENGGIPGYNLIKNTKTGKCVDADGIHHNRVYFNVCDVSNGYQNWKLNSALSGYYNYEHKVSGKCLGSDGTEFSFNDCATAKSNDSQNFT